MERKRMVGNYELVYEPDMKMFRILNNKTEEFSAWYSTEEAEELQGMDEDEFFSTAEKSLQKARNSGHEQTGDSKTEI
ncbi:hypothetical protein [Salinimicrobium terrae]|uniref:hypothetical protein n=1 Tax=Salinimicrobium terrae TaxID=470866 RepID=UPI0004142F7E|nr:hypothetical protein [Salinimicrobium terrae]